MYVDPNFKTKKALKEAVAASGPSVTSPTVRVFSPGPFPCPDNGRVTVEGPHYPKAHTWYAQVEVVNGIVTKVVS